MSPCPTCQKAIDPLRAPIAGVRDGKVVTYCSVDCQARARGHAPPRITRDSEPLPRERRDSIQAKQAWEWLDDEPAEPPHVARSGTPVGRIARMARMVVMIAAVLAVLGVAAYRLL